MSQNVESNPKQTSSPMDDEQPFPPRYWWLKRLGGGFIVFLLLVLGVRLWWGHVAHSRLDAEIARIQAAGEPIFLDDFEVEPVPDEENAAYYYRQALAAWPMSQQPDGNALYVWDAVDSVEVGDTYLEKVEPALQHLREAVACDQCDWGVRMTTPAYMTNTPSYRESRQLFRALDHLAETYFARGHHRAAIDTVDLALSLSHDIWEGPPSFTRFIMGNASQGMAIYRLEQMLRDLHIEGERQGVADQPATRMQIKGMVDRLMEVSNRLQFHQRVHIGERAFNYDTAMWAINHGQYATMTNGTVVPGEKWVIWPIRPLFEMDALFMLRFSSDMAEVAEVQTLGALKDGFIAGRYEPDIDDEDQWLHPFYDTTIRSSGTLVRSHFQALTSQQRVAVALAIHLYRVDHDRLPSSLDALVPDYLPHVPLDPMASGGRMLTYRPDGGLIIISPPDRMMERVDPVNLTEVYARSSIDESIPPWEIIDQGVRMLGHGVPIVYSVGFDGDDDNGWFYVNAEGDVDFYASRNDGDLVLPIDGPPSGEERFADLRELYRDDSESDDEDAQWQDDEDQKRQDEPE